MRARHIDRQWPTFFLRWCAMGYKLALIAALGRVWGFQAPRLLPYGRRWFSRWLALRGSL